MARLQFVLFVLISTAPFTVARHEVLYVTICTSPHHLIMRVKIMTFVRVIKTFATIRTYEIGLVFLRIPVGIEIVNVRRHFLPLVVNSKPKSFYLGVPSYPPNVLAIRAYGQFEIPTTDGVRGLGF